MSQPNVDASAVAPTLARALTPVAEPVLEARAVTKHFVIRRELFKENVVLHAVDDVSLAVGRGETLGLVGESGSGKSTLGRCLLRLIEPTAGEIFLQGRNVTALKRDELREIRHKMQMVFQDPADSLNPRFTCRRTLLDALRHAGVKARPAMGRAVELLEQVGLEAADLDKLPHQFSGGQQQRIAIARALAFDPLLLILDEPTASLDVSVQTQITKLLRDLQHRLGFSYILISHDLSSIRYVSHHVAVMYLGRLVEVGETRTVFTHPQHPYTRVLIGSVPIPDPTVHRPRVGLKGEIPSAIAPPSGCRFRTRCPNCISVCGEIEPVLKPTPLGSWVACHRTNTMGEPLVH